MNEDIKKTLINTFGRISYIFVIFFFFIYILYLHNNIPEALKEAWSASLTFLSVLATLSAAYIASSLFDGWKETQTGINRSELAKNTILSLYKLVSLCDYYQKNSITAKGVLNSRTFPDISQEAIDRANTIPSKYSTLRENFKIEFEDLYKQFQLDLTMYEKIFNTSLDLDLSIVDSYRFSIGGLLRDISLDKSNHVLNSMTRHMIEQQQIFQKEIIDLVTSATAKHININGKTPLIE